RALFPPRRQANMALLNHQPFGSWIGPLPSPNMTFTVFIVDDDAGVLKALSRRLSRRGYEVLPFDSSEKFLNEHDPQVPGCLVLDLSLPGIDGLQLQQALTAGERHRPIIFISGQGDIPSTVRAMKAGAIDFLAKPIDDAALLEAIAKAEER